MLENLLLTSFFLEMSFQDLIALLCRFVVAQLGFQIQSKKRRAAKIICLFNSLEKTVGKLIHSIPKLAKSFGCLTFLATT